MAKFDTQERQANGEAVPADGQRLLAHLVDSATAAGEIIDIYQAAGIPRPSLSDLRSDFAEQAKAAANPHQAIEALRAMLVDESAKATRHNVIRQRAFSERLKELMNKYTNQQLTSAEIIAALIEMARDVSEGARRGGTFDPPLEFDELSSYDALTTNESAVELQGKGMLAQIARELVAMMRRDATVDWTVRDDVRAKLRSQIKRLLVKYKYPPDKQPAAISLVIEQMESIAARQMT